MRKTERGTGFQGKIKSSVLHALEIAKGRSQADSGIYCTSQRGLVSDINESWQYRDSIKKPREKKSETEQRERKRIHD